MRNQIRLFTTILYFVLAILFSACQEDTAEINKRPDILPKPSPLDFTQTRAQAIHDSLVELRQIKRLIEWSVSNPNEGTRSCQCPSGHNCDTNPGNIRIHKSAQGFWEDFSCRSQFTSNGKNYTQTTTGQISYVSTVNNQEIISVNIKYISFHIVWRLGNTVTNDFRVQRELSLITQNNITALNHDYISSIDAGDEKNPLLLISLPGMTTRLEFNGLKVKSFVLPNRISHLRQLDSKTVATLDLQSETTVEFANCQNPKGEWKYSYSTKDSQVAGDLNSDGVNAFDSLSSNPLQLPNCQL